MLGCKHKAGEGLRAKNEQKRHRSIVIGTNLGQERGPNTDQLRALRVEHSAKSVQHLKDRSQIAVAGELTTKGFFGGQQTKQL